MSRKPRKCLYADCRSAKEVEKKPDVSVGRPQSLKVEYRGAAAVVLELGGQIGDCTDDCWIRARNLAQQCLYLNDNPAPEVESEIQSQNPEDKALATMADIVKQVESLPPGQARRVCSRERSPPSPQCGHGHDPRQRWVEHLQFDFRNPEADPRLAKSGVYHFGHHCMTGDPNGNKGIRPIKGSREIQEYCRACSGMFKTFHHGAFGAMTEISSFFSSYSTQSSGLNIAKSSIP